MVLFSLQVWMGKLHVGIKPGFHMGDIWWCLAKKRDPFIISSRYENKVSGETFGYFGKRRVFFARALALAALRLVKYRLTAFFLKDLTYRFMFEFFHLTFFIFVLKVNYLMQLRKNSGFAKFFLILRKSFILSILISMAETAPSCSCIIDLFIRVRG